MTDEAYRAMTSYRGQKQRCTNSNHNRYRYNGALGIRVEYTIREFVGWWLEEIKARKHWVRPTCGRIDHAQNYRFDNIQIQECSDNSLESYTRLGNPRDRTREIEAVDSAGLRLLFMGLLEAARVTGTPKDLLRHHLDGKLDSPHETLRFRYT